MAESIVSLKTCSTCKAKKPIAEFYRKRDKKDGLSSRCRQCEKHHPILTDEERRNKIHWKFIDLSGQRFGRLVAILRDKSRRGTFWSCICDCGNGCSVNANNLRRGKQNSCGCMKRELAAARHYKHGMTKSREHESWMHAKQRCINPKNAAWNNYGGRGITMCESWTDSFEQFFRDMGQCPEGHTLDRIDNNGNYEPSNCRWASRATQNRNRRDTTMITHDGTTLSISDWADRTGLPHSMLRYRYEHGLAPLFERTRRLTPSERDEIRSTYLTGTETTLTLAARFGVGRQTISNVIHRKHG